QVRVGTERELVEAVRRVSAELAGGLAEYERAAAPRKRRRIGDVHARVAAAAMRAGDRAHRVRAAAVELSKELEVVSSADLRAVIIFIVLLDVDNYHSEHISALVCRNTHRECEHVRDILI